MGDIELIGPMLRKQNDFDVVIDGYRVPHVTVEGGGNEWNIAIHGRLTFDLCVNRQALEQVLRILAAGMAVASGRSCFGPNGRPLDPFNVKVSRLDMGTDEEPKP